MSVERHQHPELERRFDTLNQSIDRIERRADRIENRLSRVEDGIEQSNVVLLDIRELVIDRLGRIEEILRKPGPNGDQS